MTSDAAVTARTWERVSREPALTGRGVVDYGTATHPQQPDKGRR